jgi:hypothetical protein
MNRKWIARAVLFVPLAVLFLAVFSFVVMRLWNWLVPPVFGWHVISFWQAVGLLILSKILFGGFRGRPGRRIHWRHRMSERWEKMTPEEREKFRQGMRGRCGSFGENAAVPKA